MVMLFEKHMLEFLEGIFDVVVHRTNQFPSSVVPFQVDSNILCWLHFKFDWILGFNGFSQMLYIIFINIFDPKSSTTKVKQIGLDSCLKYPGVVVS